MSIVAWDGNTIAADRRSTFVDMAMQTTKMQRLESGEVIAWVGDQEQGLALARWYRDGADRDKWPSFQSGDEWSRLIVADASGVHIYERLPEPQKVEEKFAAWGSGRDFAIGAMAMGASAEKAVEIASAHNIYCGNGYDVLELQKC